MLAFLMTVALFMRQRADEVATYGGLALIVAGVIVAPLLIMGLLAMNTVRDMTLKVHTAVFDPHDGVKVTLRLLRDRSHEHANRLQQVTSELELMKDEMEGIHHEMEERRKLDDREHP
jgi:hypothetical protein